MLVTTADIINSILQTILFISVIEYCVNGNKINGKGKLFLIGIIFLASTYIFTYFLGNSSISMFLIHIIQMIILGLIYNSNYLGAVIAFNMVNFAIGINVLICGNIYFGYLTHIIDAKYLDTVLIVTMYLPQYVMTYLIMSNMKSVLKSYKLITSMKYSLITIIIIIFSLDYTIAFSRMLYGKDSSLFKNFILVTYLVLLIFVTIYFANVKSKSKEISKLNEALDFKVQELKKVKHDYGAQISYLYGLHLMGKHDRLGELLKDIINGNNSIKDAVQVCNNQGSIISIVMKDAIDKGINVIIDEQFDISNLNISELELQSIISNIVSNSIRALDGKGLITARTYIRFDNILIVIQNNGPKIPDNIIEKIFEPGFSTKKSSDHGFGLSIVKELVEKYNGKISVKSNEELTEFKISLPFKVDKAM
ncbi:hypothetical protein JCM1393_08770 [Clostridium carnis]